MLLTYELNCICLCNVYFTILFLPFPLCTGMLPTFGPSWVYLYGAQRNYKILPGDDNLNEGIGEGTAYRGRLLISLNTTFEPGGVTGPSAVYKEKLQTGRVGSCIYF